MTIRCLIVDDEPPARRVLEKYISDIPVLQLEAKCSNAFETMEALHNKQIDLIFLDINMPKMTGLDFLKTLQNPPLVIITTAYREYALEGYELDVLDYLTKPIPFDRFLKAINKAVERLKLRGSLQAPVAAPAEASANYIFVKVDKVNYKIALDNILYIESLGDYIKIYTPEKNYLTNSTMKNIEAGLPTCSFIRVHKSFIVAIAKIHSAEGNMVKINNTVIPIGQTYRKGFFKLIEGSSPN